ncbi:MAG: signal recognition particle-docking protein FtsY [Rhodospirillaceae bacterium]|jgi:fused signal recognition particle receptor|nr:signal recognition particle-docking protein FtsY [Rhodospirillaceae bacterium]MBT4464932.1 signal recognition particle-docking protein FtsY [Rhodospirillaceae bacterium]MBT5013298.1 signal recognition particle-docking protein FtsY [Rhodospirillaceae bacterium]MBT5308006.1 signal recognition particle-docking protein FtsY [Rhodospirillaceae bacterium]MBT6407188.1 signal recognition particle-docking protein FtsY [Rhodospirillaceae bacterium]
MNETEGKGWLGRLKSGLGKSSSKLGGGITGLFNKRKLDSDALEELEELLITADLGAATATKIAAGIARTRFDKDMDSDEILNALAAEMEEILKPVAVPFAIKTDKNPHVVLVCGVNGSGKTTSIGKLAKQLADQGNKVMLAAGDTFRAAAVEQLQVWGERCGADVITANTGADAAGLAYEALEAARAAEADVLLIDTAGRLQNKSDLMAELEKIIRVIRKIDETAPHDCVLVLDAGVGQNAHSQVQAFADSVQISGLIMTKLDGTARGGVIVSLAEKFGLPVHAIGVGEGIEDMQPFDAGDFARALVGL